MAFSFVHPLADSDPAERTQARQDTPTAEALEWLAKPNAPPPTQAPILRRMARGTAAVGRHARARRLAETLDRLDLL